MEGWFDAENPRIGNAMQSASRVHRERFRRAMSGYTGVAGIGCGNCSGIGRKIEEGRGLDRTEIGDNLIPPTDPP
jgi:hypothetical protein